MKRSKVAGKGMMLGVKSGYKKFISVGVLLPAEFIDGFLKGGDVVKAQIDGGKADISNVV